MPEVTITGLPNATTPLTGDERVPMDQGGVTRDATTQDIANLASVQLDYTSSTQELSVSNGNGVTLPVVAPDSEPGLMTGEQARKLDDIETEANNYVLPAATDAVIGGVKPGANITVEPDGTLNATSPDEALQTNLGFNSTTGAVTSSSGSPVTIPPAGDATDFGLMTAARADKIDALRTNAQLTADLAAKADAATVFNIVGGEPVVFVRSSNPNVARPTVNGQPAGLVIFDPQGPVIEYVNALPTDLQIDLS